MSRLWREKKKNNKKTLNRSQNRDRRWVTPSQVRLHRRPPMQQKFAGRPRIHRKTPNHILEDKPWPTHIGPRSDLPSACRPCIEREELARPWLEGKGPEEAGDHCGEAHVLGKPAEVSRSDSKERNQNKEKPGHKLHRETHQKITPQPKSCEVFYWGTKALQLWWLEDTKTPVTLAREEQKTSPTLEGRGGKHHWGMEAWNLPPEHSTA